MEDFPTARMLAKDGNASATPRRSLALLPPQSINAGCRTPCKPRENRSRRRGHRLFSQGCGRNSCLSRTTSSGCTRLLRVRKFDTVEAWNWSTASSPAVRRGRLHPPRRVSAHACRHRYECVRIEAHATGKRARTTYRTTSRRLSAAPGAPLPATAASEWLRHESFGRTEPRNACDRQ